MPGWHNLVLRKPGTAFSFEKENVGEKKTTFRLTDSLFPFGYMSSNLIPGAILIYCNILVII
jgi:hypothetical protein